MTLSHVFAALYWLWLATEILAVILTRTRRSSGETHDRGSLLILWPVIFCSIWGAMQYGATHPHTIAHGAQWVRYLAYALFLVGVILRWTAILTLGKSFSVNVAIHATQTVKKNGLYRYVRHPSYTAMLIIFVALGLATRNWISLAVITIPPLLALLYRIHVEEQALLEAFGDDYATYSAHTKRLIPAIY
jgi:protein-S-isoprenylcysteine O-methyltransferase Ste14